MCKFLRGLVSPGHDSPSIPSSDAYYVYRVQRPGGLEDVVSLLPPDIVFGTAFSGAAIVGRCVKLLEKGESITDANFRPNRYFVELLHDIVATETLTLPDFQAAARRQHTGWVYVLDLRTPTPAGEVPPHDIIGAFEVRDGAVVEDSYQPSANHRRFSSEGIFKLDERLNRILRSRRRLTSQAPSSLLECQTST
jgi:hypothetical protein